MRKNREDLVKKILTCKTNGEKLETIQMFYDYSFKTFIQALESYMVNNHGLFNEKDAKIDARDFSNWKSDKKKIPEHVAKLICATFSLSPSVFDLRPQCGMLRSFSFGHPDAAYLKIILNTLGMESQTSFIQELRHHYAQNRENYPNYKLKISPSLLSRKLSGDGGIHPHLKQLIIDTFEEIPKDIWKPEPNPSIVEHSYCTPEAYHQKAKIYFEHLNYKEAEKVCLLGIEKEGDYCFLYQLLIQIYMKLDNPLKAIKAQKNHQRCMDKRELLLSDFDENRAKAFHYFESDFEASYGYFIKVLERQPNIFFDYHNIFELSLMHQKPFDPEIERMFDFFFRNNSVAPEALVIFDLLKIFQLAVTDSFTDHSFKTNVPIMLQEWQKKYYTAWIGGWGIPCFEMLTQSEPLLQQRIWQIILKAKGYRDEIQV